MDPFWKEALTVIGIAINAYVVLRLHYVASNVQKIEIATNSMKDALVASTARASQAEGEAKGRADAHAESEASRPAPGPSNEIDIKDVDAIKLKS